MIEVKKTQNYDMFKFRQDNRAGVDQKHVMKIVESIRSKNLLEFRPILVNSDFEVMDGQHRLLAAKQLGVEIYYEMNQELESKDVLLLNTSKNWTLTDYFNYYCVNNFPEYLKLKKFMVKTNINLKIALSITISTQSKNAYFDFKNGLFKIDEDCITGNFNVVWKTIDYLNSVNGMLPYANSSRFWKAMMILINDPCFNEKSWDVKMRTNAHMFYIKSRTKDYLEIFEKVYNFRNTKKVNLEEKHEDY